MNDNLIIIIFTKDKLDSLKKTLSLIEMADYKKFVIDDSTTFQNREGVITICEQFARCHYLGQSEFTSFVTTYGIAFPEFDFLLRMPGTKDWNLGYARNFGLLYSKSIGADRVLFMDDDINVHDINIIHNLFRALDDFHFVGANIAGVADDSLLGHIATELGFTSERMISGGFMIFKPNMVTDFFLNFYNEDWIWLYLQIKNRNVSQFGVVFQEIFNPFEDYLGKVDFQEFGELIIEAIATVYYSGSIEDLHDEKFWLKTINSRGDFIEELYNKAKTLARYDYCNIIETARQTLESFQAKTFSQLFKKYFAQKRIFESLYKTL